MRRKLIYVTSNPNKREEFSLLLREWRFSDGKTIKDVFEMDVRSNVIDERLEMDLETLVRYEAIRAYQVVRVPCMVEHAGLVFDDLRQKGFPGGLTKPIWNALGAQFVQLFQMADREASAKAAVGYCDGMTVRTFVGEARGRLVTEARGEREYYWDTVFVPEDEKRPASKMTYAEIVGDEGLGLRYKVMELSQSTKALAACLEHVRQGPANVLWR